MRCVVVASGPSARGFRPPAGATVIAVNGAIDWIERADYWFTLDPSAMNMRRMAKPRADVLYFAAVPEGFELPWHVNQLLRVAGRGSEPAYGTPQWWMWRWSAMPGISPHIGRIHSGNSAWGALQLAVHLGAERIALVGVDANQKERLGGGRPNNLSHLPLLFDSINGEAEVVNCGAMVCRLPHKSIRDGMKWLMR